MGKFSVFNRLMKTSLVIIFISLTHHFATCNNVKGDEGDPYFLKTETNVTVHEGDLARLKCRVANLGTKMVNVVVWRRVTMDFPLTIGDMTFSQFDEMSVDHSQITPTSSNWDLLIKSVKPSHAGIYECHISANHHIAQYITLNVQEGPLSRSDLKMSGTKFVRQGEKIHLVCNATGSARAPEDINWFFDGRRIHPANAEWQGRVEITRQRLFEGKYFISELIVEHSTLDDKGDYVCQSSDLTVDNVKVHVLSVDKGNLTRRGLVPNEANNGDQRYTAQTGAANLYRSDILHMLLFAIITRIWM